MLPHFRLFCYTAAGWYNEKFYVPAVRIENDIRQECAGYDQKKLEAGAKQLLEAYPHNRLVKHLTKNCCTDLSLSCCTKLFFGKMGMPCSCFAGLQCKLYWMYFFAAEEETIVSTQDRLTFKPTAEEIVEYTVPHLETAPYPIISFGQGCEGEPLLMWETIMRSHYRNKEAYK